MNYTNLYQAIQDYAENTEALFVQNIPTFVMEAEDRIYNTVNIPALRKNVTGNLTVANPYLSCPNDFLASYSIAIFTADYVTPYTYLINKDVSFIREAYPIPSTPGTPKYYSLFGPQYNNLNELSFLLGPTPDQAYLAELHYFYYPPSIVQGQVATVYNQVNGALYSNGNWENIPLTGGSGTGAVATIVVANGAVTTCTITNGGNFYAVGDVLSIDATALGAGTGAGFTVTVFSVGNATGTSWLGDNFDPVLFYGAMREAMIFMKGEADMVKYYDQKYAEAMTNLQRLCDGMERGDAYRDGQTKLDVSGRAS